MSLHPIQLEKQLLTISRSSDLTRRDSLNHRTTVVSAIVGYILTAPIGKAQIAPPEPIPVSLLRTPEGALLRSKPTFWVGKPERDPFWSKPKSPVRFRKTGFVILSAAVYGAAFADMHQTLKVRNLSWWYETDPLAKPFVRLPAPAYYAAGIAMATGVNWLSWKMGHSKRWRKLSPVPQLLSIAGNIRGFRTNRY